MDFIVPQQLAVALLVFLGADGPMRVDFVTPAFSTYVSQDIIYSHAAIVDHERSLKPLLLDVYQPTGDGAPRVRPAFLALHGGGWTIWLLTCCPTSACSRRRLG
jgi:acetyl esterase/lipase